MNLRSSKAKVLFDLKQTINATCVYKNKACVYRFLLGKNNFGNKEKEVCKKETVTYLLMNLISFYKEA
ncbi:hypothetical protein FNW54_09120 [Bacteroides sp. HF-5092]|nr:hypothetical protein FNW54_09120 [Bacteroides sp. HF-5092]